MKSTDEAPGATPTHYPMRVVTRRTGLTPDVLRVWERRYGVVKPTRSEGGQRLYSVQDLERLTALSRLVRAGHRIAMLAPLGERDLDRLLDESTGATAVGQDERAAEIVARALDAAARFDDAQLEHALRVAALSFTPDEWIETIVHPFLVEVGERWHRGEMTPANEHLASATVRDTLGWVLASLEPMGDAPVLVAATPAGEMHEFGALMCAVIAARAGWRVRYLGPNLPAEVLADCAKVTGARAVALSIVHASEDPIMKEIRRLRSLLPREVSLVVGGRGAAQRARSLAELEVAAPGDASALREHLDALRSS